jgi:hypothetical protein
MICRSADAREYSVTDVANTVTAEEPVAIYLRDTPMGNALGWIGVVLVVLTVIVSALLACPVYAFIWLSRKVRPLGRHFSRVETSAQKDRRHYRLKSLHGTVTTTGQTLKYKLRYRL